MASGIQVLENGSVRTGSGIIVTPAEMVSVSLDERTIFVEHRGKEYRASVRGAVIGHQVPNWGLQIRHESRPEAERDYLTIAGRLSPSPNPPATGRSTTVAVHQPREPVSLSTVAKGFSPRRIAVVVVVVVALLAATWAASGVAKGLALDALKGVYVTSGDDLGSLRYVAIDGARMIVVDAHGTDRPPTFGEGARPIDSVNPLTGAISSSFGQFEVRNWRTDRVLVLVAGGHEYSKSSVDPKTADALRASIVNYWAKRFSDELQTSKTRCSFCGNTAVTYEPDGSRRCAAHQIKSSKSVGSSSGISGGSSSDWEANAKSATRKLWQGRTDLTQDEYDAYRQSEAEYNATH